MFDCARFKALITKNFGFLGLFPETKRLRLGCISIIMLFIYEENGSDSAHQCVK